MKASNVDAEAKRLEEWVNAKLEALPAIALEKGIGRLGLEALERKVLNEALTEWDYILRRGLAMPTHIIISRYDGPVEEA